MDRNVELTVVSAEIGEGAGTHQIEVRVMGAAATRELTIPFDVGGTADGADYSLASSSFVIPKGGRTGTLTATINGDAVDEPDETLVFTLRSGKGVQVSGGASFTLTIRDDDDGPSLAVAAQTAGESAGTAEVVVTLTGLSASVVTVDYATVAGSAAAGADFTGVTGTLTFSPGEATETISVPIVGDTIDEDDETFTVQLSNAAGGTIATGSAVVTITDDDASVFPTVSIDDVQVSEGDDAVLTVTLAQAGTRPVTVAWATADGSAGVDDYTAASGTLTFAPGELQKTLVVATVSDGELESTEAFVVNLSSPANATLADAQGAVTVLDVDTVPSLTVADITVAETDGTATLEVTLSSASGNVVSVAYATANDSALAGDDYEVTGGTLTFAPGATTMNVDVPLVDDGVAELVERFTVELSAENNATLADASAQVTVLDDDAIPTVSVGDASTSEGQDLTFTISLTQAVSRPVTVDIALAATPPAGTAVEGVDYSAFTATTLTVAPGATTTTFAIGTLTDNVKDGTKTLFVELGDVSASGALGDARGDGAIFDIDATPDVTIDDVSLSEADATGRARFTVTLSGQSGNTVTLEYSTADGSATVAGGDYEPIPAAGGANPVLVFSPGQTQLTIDVIINDDSDPELNESFSLNLGTPSGGALLADDQGICTLYDDESIAAITITDVTRPEQDGPFVFDVTLSSPSGTEVVVDFDTQDGPLGAGGAVDGLDYTATSGTLTFAIGETSKQVTVPVLNDPDPESVERFFLNLTLLSGSATIPDSQGVGTILDDDTVVGLAISDATTSEGGDLVLTVSLSQASGNTVSVDYGLATTPPLSTAVAGVDFTAFTADTLSFTPGQVSRIVTVATLTDGVEDGTKLVEIALSNASASGTLTDDRGVGTIFDVDATPTVTVDDVTAVESDASMTFTVTLSEASGNSVEVAFAAGGGSATSGVDYSVVTASPLTFAPGELTKTITVNLASGGHDDLSDEGTETFEVTLSGATAGAVTCNSPSPCAGTGTILDDDVIPVVSIDSVVASESDADMTFTVALSEASGNAIDVAFAAGGGLATLGADYSVTTASPLTFAPGELTKTIVVELAAGGHDDADDEGVETFNLTLTSAAGGATTCNAPGACAGVGTILDDDVTPTVSIDDVTVSEFAPTMTFTVTLSEASGNTIDVSFSAGGGTATLGADYSIVTASPLTFAPGELSKTITVNVAAGSHDDALDEGTETFELTLGSATGGGVLCDAPSPCVGTGTILDDDVTPIVDIDDVTASELDDTMTFTVTLSEASGNVIEVDYAAAAAAVNGATPGLDFELVPDTLTFLPNEVSKTIVVDLGAAYDDMLVEGTESFNLGLTGPTGGAVLCGTPCEGVGTILDDESIPSVSITDVSAGEQSGTFVFDVALSFATGADVTLAFTTTDGPLGPNGAVAGQDYASTTGSLTFTAGEFAAKQITVNVTNDVAPEQSEVFFVDLSLTAGSALLADPRGTGTLLDDDTIVGVSISDVSVSEGQPLTYVVSLSQASGNPVSVDYAVATTAPLSTAVAGVDYSPFAAATLSFAPGEISKNVSVTTLTDGAADGTKRLSIELANASASATISDGRGDGLIFDVDATPTITIDDVTLSEAATAPNDLFVFTVSLSGASGNTVTVQAATQDDTATAGSDYVAVSPAQLVSFAPGVTTRTVVVPVLDDLAPEPIEGFWVNLASATGGATLCGSPCRGRGTVLDDESTPNLVISDVAQGEQNTSFTFNVSLSFASGDTITVDWSTADGSATVAGGDYTGVGATTLTFDPGETSHPVTVNVTNDGAAEPTETFFVNLAALTGNAALTDAQGLGTIYDDDTIVGLSFSDATVLEGGNLVLTAALSQASGNTISVNYALATTPPFSTAVPAVDYTVFAPGTFTYTPGETSKTLTIATLTDGVTDGTKLLHVDLSGASAGASLTDARGTGTILDANAVPMLLSATTRDLDGDGQIDTYRLVFDEAVDEATFPGYVDASTLGSSAQTDWLVAGHSSVRLIPSGLSPEGGDTATDATIYVRFTESGTHDTGTRPDVTTSATPGLRSLGGTQVGVVGAGFTGEVDGAAPVLTRATSESGLTTLNVFFSEAVYGGATCPGGNLQVAGSGRHLTYTDGSGGNVADLANTGDLDGSDGKIVPGTAGSTAFAAADIGNDSVAAVAGAIRDAACNAAGSTPVPVSLITHPTVLIVTSASESTLRVEFTEDVVGALATQGANYSLTEESGTCPGTPSLAATGTAVSGSIYEFATGLQDSGCIYRLTVTGPIVDVDEGAAMGTPNFGTFVGQQKLRVVSAQATSLREFVITFSKPVLDSGTGGANNLSYYTISGSLGTVTAAQRLASDARKVKITHSLDQGGAFYSVVVSTQLRTATCTSNCPETLLPSPFDRTTFQGLGGQVTQLEQGALFVDPFGDGTSFAFVFQHKGQIYAGPNDNNSSVFRFDPDGSNTLTVTFATGSASGTPPYSSFGSNIERPATRITNPTGTVTRYYLPPGVSLSAFAAGNPVTVSGCANVANNATTTLTAVSDAGDYVEVNDGSVAATNTEPVATPITPGPETCVVAINNNAGPLSYDGVDAFVAASISGAAAGEYLLFGGHNIGAGAFNEIHFTTEQDALLDNTFCNIAAVTLGNSTSLQMFYGYGEHIYMGMASSNASAPVLAYFQPQQRGTGNPSTECVGLSDDIASSGTGGAKFINYLGINGTPKNTATVVGIDSIVAFDDGTGVQLYIANNGGIARTPTIPPVSATWTPIRHDFAAADAANSWPSGTTTQAVPGTGKLRPGDKGVPLMVPWDGALYVGRNRTDGAAELWRYNAADGWDMLIDTSTHPDVDATNTDISMIIVNGGNLYVGFDNETVGATVWRISDSAATTLTALNFEKAGEDGLGPVGGSDLDKNKHILSYVSVPFAGADYLYLTVGCVTDFHDDGQCDRLDSTPGATDFAIRLFRQVD